MKLYISGSFSDRDRLTEFANNLSYLGEEITSSWLTEPIIKVEGEHDAWEKRARANEDLLDVERSDALLLVTYVESSTGGYNTELGIALANRKPIYLVGPKRSVFMYSNYVSEILPYEWNAAVDRVFSKERPTLWEACNAVDSVYRVKSIGRDFNYNIPWDEDNRAENYGV